MKLTRNVSVLTIVHPASDTRVLHKEARSLAESGWSVALVAKGCHFVTENVRCIELPGVRRRLLRFTIAPWILLWKALRTRADIYHFHDPELLGVAVVLKLLTRARLVFDVHENIPAQILAKGWIPRPFRRPISTIYRRIERLLLPAVDAVILAEDSYEPLYAWHHRVRVIRNYPIASDAVGRSESTSAGFRVVYVGGITVGRGARTMIEAAEDLQRRGVPSEWALIGPMDDALERELRDYIAEHDLTDSVRLCGRLPFSQAQEIVAQADVGLAVLQPLANYVESVPTKLLEYVVAGLPVIASDFPLWRRLIDELECGLVVPPDDPEALADRLEQLYRDPGLRRAMSEKGRRNLIESGMTWETECRRLLDLYEELSRS